MDESFKALILMREAMAYVEGSSGNGHVDSPETALNYQPICAQCSEQRDAVGRLRDTSLICSIFVILTKRTHKEIKSFFKQQQLKR